MRFDDLAEINPSVPIRKGDIRPFIDMSALPQHARDVSELGEREFTGSGSRFQNGDTLIARITPCLENGKGALVHSLPEGVPGFGSTEFIVARARSERDTRFVYYLTRSEEFRDIAISRMEGTSGRQRVSWQQIASIEIPDLRPDEREEIGNILGLLDDKIELNRRMAATLEEMARALYRSWFVDFDPVKAKAEGLAPAFMDEATAALFPDRFGDDGLPDVWEMMPLSSLCVQVKDSIDPRKNTDRIFDHYSLPAFDAGKGPVREPGSAIQSQKLRIPTEAILFSRLNPTTPRIWWARTSDQVFASVASTEFLVAVARIKGDMPFLYSLLVSDEFRGDVISRVTGTSNSHQRVKPGSVLDIEVVGATHEIRAAYGAVTAQWFDRIDELSQENRTLAALRDSLLPKLMSGELRVGEARDQIEEVA